MVEEPMLTSKQAAAHIGVSDQAIYNWIADGIVRDYRARGMKKKKRYLIPASEVERLRQAYEGLDEVHDYGLVASA